MNAKTMDYTPSETEGEKEEFNTFNTDAARSAQDAATLQDNSATGTELVVIGNYDMVKLFSSGGADPLLDEIEKQAESIVKDVTTEKGRKEIASMAYQIARSKTALDAEGKKLKEQHQKVVNEVDAERKKIRDRLDTLKEKVRAPLTEFEEREKLRVDNHNTRLESLKSGDLFEFPDPDINQINERINLIEDIYDRDWEEFSDTANAAYVNVKDRLNKLHASRTKHDEEAAELERLRKEKEERERKEREEALKKEAAEKARKEAEQKAAKEKAESEARAKAEQERLQKEKEEAERKAKEQAERAKREKKEAAEKAEREKREAVEAERKRQEEENRKAEEERQKREADKKHKKDIQRQIYVALEAIMAEHPPHEWNIKLIEAMDAGKIPHVRIEY